MDWEGLCDIEEKGVHDIGWVRVESGIVTILFLQKYFFCKTVSNLNSCTTAGECIRDPQISFPWFHLSLSLSTSVSQSVERECFQR